MQSLLLGTLVFMVGHINLVATQVMQADENRSPVTYRHMAMIKQRTELMI